MNTPEEKEKQVFQEELKKRTEVKIESPLQALYLHCIVNDILCKNIDCRTSAECFDPVTNISRLMKPQEIVDLAQETAKKIYQEKLANFATIFPKFKKLVEKLGDHGNTPLDELKKRIKDE